MNFESREIGFKTVTLKSHQDELARTIPLTPYAAFQKPSVNEKQQTAVCSALVSPIADRNVCA